MFHMYTRQGLFGVFFRHINRNLVQRFLSVLPLLENPQKIFSPGPELTPGGPGFYLCIFRNLKQLKLSP